MLTEMLRKHHLRDEVVGPPIDPSGESLARLALFIPVSALLYSATNEWGTPSSVASVHRDRCVFIKARVNDAAAAPVQLSSLSSPAATAATKLQGMTEASGQES